MSNADEFLNTYRDLEEVLSVRYGTHAGLVQEFASKDGEKYREELNLFREMRNLLSHHGRLDGQRAVEPSDAAVKKLYEILEFAKDPPAAMSIATKRSGLFCAAGNDFVASLTDAMEKRGYSHIPVVSREGRLLGVFSVGTLFAFAKRNPDRPTKGLKISDLWGLLEPENHTTEQFAFAAPSAGIYTLKRLFTLNGPFSRRVAAVFVTDTGLGDGRLLGMITPWDVFKVEK